MKTQASPFFTPRIERPLAPEMVNPEHMKSWLKKQKRTNVGYFKNTCSKNKIKSFIKQSMPKNFSEKIPVGESYSGHKVYLQKYSNKLPKLIYNGFVLKFSDHINEQTYTLNLDSDYIRDCCLSSCGGYFVISFQYKNSDLEKVLLFDLKTKRFLKMPFKNKFIGDFIFVWSYASELIFSYTKPQAFFKKEKGLEVSLLNLGEKGPNRFKKLFSSKRSIPGNIYFEENEDYKGIYIVMEDYYSSSIYYKDLNSSKRAELIKDLNFEKTKIVDIIEKKVFYTENSSNKNNGQISSYDLYSWEKEVLVPEYKNLIINETSLLFERFIVVSYLDKNLKNYLKVFNLQGKLLYSQKFEQHSTLNFYENNTDKAEIIVNVSNFEFSHYFYINLDEVKLTKEIIEKTPLWGKIETKFGHYTSFDGEKIPYFLISPKKGEIVGTILYAYGSFFDHTLPTNQSSILSSFLQMNGSVMMPCVRGGGERGYFWNREGAGINKIKSIRDYLSAAEFLFQKKYSNPEQLVAHGVSGGGLVVSAAVNFKPEYFKAALPFVGLMDMLNYQSYCTSDNWVKEYGEINKMSVYSAISKYCPVNKVKKQSYPSILAITGSHDVRVAPIHTYKFVDKVQRFNESENPILLENVKNHGHFAYEEPKALSKTLRFLIKELDIKLP